MPTVLFEEVESEIIDKKLKQGIYGIDYLIDIAGEITERERTSLNNVINFCLEEITARSYYEFAIETLTDDKLVFESKYDVSVDTVRKLILKHMKSDVERISEEKDNEDYTSVKSRLVNALTEQMDNYRDLKRGIGYDK
ncbi:hypothetical protein ACWEXK_12420 [Staphylococcus xylosus]